MELDKAAPVTFSAAEQSTSCSWDSVAPGNPIPTVTLKQSKRAANAPVIEVNIIQCPDNQSGVRITSNNVALLKFAINLYENPRF